MKERNVGMDVMRVIAMICIITHHFIVDEYHLRNLSSNTFDETFLKTYVLMCINAIVVIGVNLFFLSSGYFRINIKRSFIHLIIKIYLIALTVFLLGIMKGILDIKIDKDYLLKPYNIYWYIGVYLCLVLFSPYLNMIIDFMTKENYRFFVVVFFAVFCIYGYYDDVNLHIHRGYSLLMAAALYIIGGGVSKFFEVYSISMQRKLFFH